MFLGKKHPLTVTFHPSITISSEFVFIFILNQAIHEEVTNLGSEDLLLWQNPEEKRDSLMSSFSWLSNSIAPNLTSAINSINSTLETMLTVEDDEVDTQF